MTVKYDHLEYNHRKGACSYYPFWRTPAPLQFKDACAYEWGIRVQKIPSNNEMVNICLEIESFYQNGVGIRGISTYVGINIAVAIQ